MTLLRDDRWAHLKGGYRVEYDPRPALSKLEKGQELDRAWQELWDELHHQGDVGEASYAAVPELVRIHKQRRMPGWNVYAICAVIELARIRPGNPEVPDWLREDYFGAIRELAAIGAAEILQADDPDAARAMLAVIAIGKGLRKHADFLVRYSDSEAEAIEPP